MNSKSVFDSPIRISVWLVVILFITFDLSAAIAGDSHKKEAPSVLASPLTLFQSTISKADGQRCPMYPSCSHYAAQAVERHGKLLGWVLTADRLLRCGRDEIHRVPTVIVNDRQRAYDPLETNTFWWSSP